MRRPVRSPYVVLGVSLNASEDQIRAAFRGFAHLHPDQRPGDPDATKRFAEISEAYGILSNADDRGKYDRAEDPYEMPDAPAGSIADAINPDVAAVAAFAQEELPGIIEALKAADTGEPIGVRVVRAGRGVGRSVLAKTKTPEGQAQIKGAVRLVWDALLSFDRAPSG